MAVTSFDPVLIEAARSPLLLGCFAFVEVLWPAMGKPVGAGARFILRAPSPFAHSPKIHHFRHCNASISAILAAGFRDGRVS